MKKNLVLYHLEAMPQSLFWQYASEMPNFWKIQRQSMYFSNCYVAGGATQFAFNSISYGAVSGLDHLAEYNGLFTERPIGDDKGLFELLRDNGYFTILQKEEHRTQPLEIASMPGFEQAITWKHTEEGYPALKTLFETIGMRQPFALFNFIQRDILHPCEEVFQKTPDLGPPQLHRLILRRNDEKFGDLLRILDESGVMDDTIIVVFGDHGVSAMNRGATTSFTSGVVTGAEQSWVPMFIHNSRLGSGLNSDLVSLDDLRDTILGLLFPGREFAKANLPFTGVDISRNRRAFAFTQNTYALRRNNFNPKRFLKSYAITDGDYRLQTLECEPGNDIGGMSMYLDHADSGNNCDLLEYFEYDDAGKAIGIFTPSYASSAGVRIFHTLNPAAMLAMMQRYETLREELRRYVREKERHALSVPDSQPNIMPEASFTMPRAVLARRTRIPQPCLGKGMNWLVEQDRPVLVFGASWFGRGVAALLRFHKCVPAGFIDNMVESQGTERQGLMVYSPEAAAAAFPGAIALGACRTLPVNMAMKTQSAALGFEYHNFAYDIIGVYNRNVAAAQPAACR